MENQIPNCADAAEVTVEELVSGDTGSETPIEGTSKIDIEKYNGAQAGTDTNLPVTTTADNPLTAQNRADDLNPSVSIGGENSPAVIVRPLEPQLEHGPDHTEPKIPDHPGANSEKSIPSDITPSGPHSSSIDIGKLQRNGGTQVRAEMNEEIVKEYAEAMTKGEKFPPAIAYDDGEKYWLADGFHRAAGAEMAGLKTIDVELRKGNRSDAIKFALGANAVHGLRRSNADKLRALGIAIEHFNGLSNRAIADICGVSEQFVRSHRGNCDQSAPENRIGLDGKKHPAKKKTKIGTVGRLKKLAENSDLGGTRARRTHRTQPDGLTSPKASAPEAAVEKTNHDIQPETTTFNGKLNYDSSGNVTFSLSGGDSVSMPWPDGWLDDFMAQEELQEIANDMGDQFDIQELKQQQRLFLALAQSVNPLTGFNPSPQKLLLLEYAMGILLDRLHQERVFVESL